MQGQDVDVVREWASQFAHPHRRIEVEAQEFRQGASAVAVVGQVAEYSGDLQTANLTVGWVFEVTDGKIVRGEGFSDPVYALRIASVWD